MRVWRQAAFTDEFGLKRAVRLVRDQDRDEIWQVDSRSPEQPQGHPTARIKRDGVGEL
jgi:hypothetical protein